MGTFVDSLIFGLRFAQTALFAILEKSAKRAVKNPENPIIPKILILTKRRRAGEENRMPAREHEHTLNVWLAELLRDRGLDARQESAQGGRRIDVDIRVGPVKIALEAEQGQSAAKKSEAIRDADSRLAQNLADCAIAVCYPDGIAAREDIPQANLLWNIRATPPPNVRSSADSAVWGSADLDELARIIRLAPMQLGNPDHAAASLSVSLDIAVGRLGESQKSGLAKHLDLPRSKGREGTRYDKAAKRALLVVASAVMFHARLDAHLKTLAPLRDNRKSPPAMFSGDWPPKTARECADSDEPTAAFSEAWNLILALDYKPIFETARAALHACPPDPAFANAIRETAKAALAVAGNIAGMRHDLMGRVFHTVLDTARYDGSFYTTTAAATLLASLAISDGMRDWSAPNALDDMRIIDPACGTGTLLMAAAERIRDLAPRTRDDDQAARTLIERVLSGYDVNLTATHMAATALGLLSPSAQFQDMKIYRTLLGVDGGKAYLGSLEFLDKSPMLMPWPNAARAVEQIDGGEESARPEPADLVIMNPPFTRDSLRHDQFSKPDESKMKAREKTLFADSPVHLSGNSGPFVILADRMAKPNAGTLAAILPLVNSANASFRELRQFLGRNYHVETIVTSHDPTRIYFSENTNIGEMLLICRKWTDAEKPKPPTRIVNLAVNPATPADAINLASAIENESVESQNYGTVQEWASGKIARGDWGGVQFLSPYLCERFSDLAGGALFSVAELGNVADTGPAGQGIRGVFDRSNMPGADGMAALWHHKTDIIKSMSATTDTHIIPKRGKESAARRLWEQCGSLMLPTRTFLKTVRMFSVRLDAPALGSAWVPCKPIEEVNVEGVSTELLEKALCVYFNSTVGILAMLGNRSNKKPTYPQFSMDDLRKVFVPDFKALGADAVRDLSRAYDALSRSEILPLPRMDICPTRRALDDAVCAALGLDGELAAEIRRSLAAEPSVTGRRYGG